MSMTEQEQRIAASLHESIFWKEFTFSKNDFKPQGGTEVQLADGVVLAGDTLILYQMKDRDPGSIGTQEAERKWFKNTIESDARDQIKKSLSYLKSLPRLELANHRGDLFNLTACAANEILKIIVFANSGPLPADCRRRRHISSKSAGFIHVFEESDYTLLVNTLRVPFEIVQYLRYREIFITRQDLDATITERALLGHFIAEADTPLTPDSSAHLDHLDDDREHWDLTPLLCRLRDRLLDANPIAEYYPVLRAFARLPLYGWRQVRANLSHCAIKAGESPCLRRLIDPRTGIAVLMVDDLLLRNAGSYGTLRELDKFRRMVRDFKYLSRVDCCVGLIFRPHGSETDIGWACIEEPWRFDPDLEEATYNSWLAEGLHGVRGKGLKFSDGE